MVWNRSRRVGLLIVLTSFMNSEYAVPIIRCRLSLTELFPVVGLGSFIVIYIGSRDIRKPKNQEFCTQGGVAAMIYTSTHAAVNLAITMLTSEHPIHTGKARESILYSQASRIWWFSRDVRETLGRRVRAFHWRILAIMYVHCLLQSIPFLIASSVAAKPRVWGALPHIYLVEYHHEPDSNRNRYPG